MPTTNNTVTTAVKSKTVAVFEDYLKGDLEANQKKAIKQRITSILGATPQLEFHPIDEIVPITKQRMGKPDWARKKLAERGGFDLPAFGAISIIKVNGQLLVWNGLQRTTIARVAGYRGAVPCLVYDINEQMASDLFAYTQDEGKRTLSKESIFQNKVFANHAPALEIADVLKQLNLYVKGDCVETVPENPQEGAKEISYRGIEGAWRRIAQQDIRPLERAVNTMYQVLGADQKIPNDIWYAVTACYVAFPRMTKEVEHRFTNFVDAMLKTQAEKDLWIRAKKGITGNVSIAEELGRHLWAKFIRSGYGSRTIANRYTVKSFGVKDEQ